MPLELRSGSSWWYGRIGKARNCVPLRIEVCGLRPPHLRLKGDEEFEISRVKAQAKLEELEKATKESSTAEDQLRRLHKIRTGTSLAEMRLVDMFAAYAELPRNNPKWKSSRYASQLNSLFQKFAAFCSTLTPKIQLMSEVTPEAAAKFLRIQYEKGIIAKTRNNDLVALRGAFNLLGPQGSIYKNPFDGIHKFDEDDSIPRKPFVGAELKAIIEASVADPFIHPIIVAAAATAARRENCCTLRREQVDLKAGIVRIKPGKKGARVRVPLFAMLRAILQPILERPGNPTDFIFPEQAEMMRRDPQQITDRVRRVLLRVGFIDEGSPELALNQTRARGQRRASIRSLHSFRTTWVTMALMAGVPEKLIVLVTGHKTLEVVLEHYFNPSDRELKAILEAKMPGVITGGMSISVEAKRDRAMRTLLARMTAENWSASKDDLLDLLSENENAELIPHGSPSGISVGTS